MSAAVQEHNSASDSSMKKQKIRENEDFITFAATTNKISPGKVVEDEVPVKEAIDTHRALKGKKIEIVQHSASDKKDKNGTTMAVCESGLVSTVLTAYNQHHNLVLRPDDVWQAILSQFSIYLEHHAEEHRDKIVDFKGQKELVIFALGTLRTVDFGRIANRMVDEQILTNIKDPTIVEWLLPCFSTTTKNDRIAASVSVMSAMQKYFKYKVCLRCGIPKVTLMGTTTDWELLRGKIDGLLRFEGSSSSSKYIKTWHNWLAYIGDNLVESSKGNIDIEFWDRIASRQGGGSGATYISGWVSAFAVWSDEGKWQGLTEVKDWRGTFQSTFPVIDTNNLPAGVVSVPVLVDDNGVEYQCKMFTGQFGLKKVVDEYTIAPCTDWCIGIDHAAPVTSG